MMKATLTIAIFVLFVCSVYPQCQVNVGGLGAKFLSSQGAPGVSANGDEFSVSYGQRAIITNACIGAGQNWDPNGFTNFFLLNQTLSVEVDLSSVGCGCNSAMYLVSMPGRNPDGSPNVGEGDYYCDANDVGKQWCPEMDLMEANNAAVQVTPHQCYSMNGQQFTNCDRAGDGKKSNQYGVGKQINTQNSFNISWTFNLGDDGNLASINTVFSQGDQVVNLPNTDSGYVSKMTDAFKKGMVLVVSHWSGATGGDMSWLDVPPCDINVACNRGGVVKFKNLAVAPAPQPARTHIIQ